MKKSKKRVILDAHWCTDGVWRCDLVPVDHREPDADRAHEEIPNYKWGERRYSWDRSYSTYAEPNHRQQEEELESLSRFLSQSRLFDEEYMRVLRRRYGIDKDPPG